jgi:HEAT repeat protein
MLKSATDEEIEMYRKTQNRILTVCLLGLIVATAPLCAAESERELLATLQSETAELFDKMMACKRLTVVGTEAAVPVLADLLDDEKLAHMARYGLEPIPSVKVDQALIAALSTLQGENLVGVINSIGNRGKATAIPALAKKLQGADRNVAKAAAQSIARLGTDQAAKVLGDSMSAEFAGACLVCGKTLAAQGNSKAAAAMLTKLRALEDAPKHIRLAAMLQAVTLQGSESGRLLASALASDDKATFRAALRTVRLLESAEASTAVKDALKDAPSEHAALLLTALADLADAGSLPTVVEAVKSDDIPVKLAALQALASLGNADHTDLLMDAVSSDSEEIASAAQTALASLPGDDVDAAILAQLDNSDRQSSVITLIGERRIANAVPKLLPLLSGPHADAVITALGETIVLDQLDILGTLLETSPDERQEVIQSAIHAACYRMPDRDATASKLEDYLDTKNTETIAFLMDELRTIGGEKALAIVGEAAASDNDTFKDYATRALGEWLDTTVAPVLLNLAKKEGTGKYGIRGLRGYVRLARQFSMPEADRAAMCRTVLATASRDSEKELVLDVLRRYPSLDMLQIAIEVSEIPALKRKAAKTALAISQKIGAESQKVQLLLAQLGQGAVKVEIIKAEYGAGDTWKDVTKTLQQSTRNLPLIVLKSDRYNTVFGGDPAKGTPKTLKIQYKINGKLGEVTLRENATILLPIPK